MTKNKEVLNSISATTTYRHDQVEKVFDLFKSYDDTIMCLEIMQSSNKDCLWIYGRVQSLEITMKDLHSLFIGVSK